MLQPVRIGAYQDRLLLAALPFIPLALLVPSLNLVIEEWRTDRPFGYGFLIAVMAGIASWRIAGRNRSQVLPGGPLAYAALLVGCVCWFVGVSVSAGALHVAAAVALGAVAVWCVFGLRSALQLGPAVGLLMLAVPVWEIATGLLQRLSIASVEPILSASGIPVAFDGPLVLIPGGTFEIAAGCSGISFLISAVALSLFVCVLDEFGPTRTIRVVVAFAALAIVSNWIRIAVIVSLGHYTSMANPIVLDHGWLGWILFVAFSMPMVMFLRRLPLEEPLAEPSGVIACSASSTPDIPKVRVGPCSRWLKATFVMMPLAFVVSFVEWAAPPLEKMRDKPFQWPAALGEMRLESTSMEAELKDRIGPHAAPPTAIATYRADDGQFVVFSVVSRNHPLGSDAMPEGRALIPHQHAVSPAMIKAAAAPTDDDRASVVSTLAWRDIDGSAWVTSYSYVVGPMQAATRLKAKLLVALRPFDRRGFVGVLAATRRCSRTCELAVRQNELSIDELRARLL